MSGMPETPGRFACAAARRLPIYLTPTRGSAVTERSIPSQVALVPRGAAAALDAAIVALRRGDPVLLTGARDGMALVVAAELVNDDNLRRLHEISTRPPNVVLTR